MRFIDAIAVVPGFGEEMLWHMWLVKAAANASISRAIDLGGSAEYRVDALLSAVVLCNKQQLERASDICWQ